MMKTRKLFSFFALVLIAVGLSSCLGDAKQTFTTERTLSSQSNMSVVTDLSTNETYIVAQGGQYQITYESTEKVINIVGSLQVANGGGMYTFKIENVKFDYDRFGAIDFRLESYRDSQNNVEITDFNFNYIQRSIGSYAMPVFTMSYVIDGRYSVRVVQTALYCFGSTKGVQLDNSKEVLDTEAAYYCITLDPRSVVSGSMEVTGRMYLYNILLPGRSKDDYIIENNVKVNLSPWGYKLSGVNADLKLQSRDEKIATVNSVSADTQFSLTDDGQKRNPNVLGYFVMDNKYRFDFSLGYSFTQKLIEELDSSI